MELELTIAKYILYNILVVFFIGIGCVFTLGFQMFQGLVF
jgi:hypothetical protein